MTEEITSDTGDLFDIIRIARSMRRLKTDPGCQEARRAR
jgi:hypothetical protein